ncbi:hypothetical protein PF002_g13163 [Phytophthora fragariae]|uniref:Uncharacterized protein n=1 Tax=Phytophthora fragariae TaxID=53985 RepID=A0A6A3F0F0_9STRA|nr:hypothetical protein PF003_g17330 [Phytophthora fragariae]KAE8939215.1 hypothetical protein PF009_g10935 [Phytophthora fragariae]KAE9008825.1 hypothetical protein PF011_g10550 [Phytophthora fragariae]KAE9110097.1 hypothetical protein PF007_g11981 [Phytophthora fragariae]KAE9229925.1 hypothetical protein PF002_g13163 [Phytophthora fragariae]
MEPTRHELLPLTTVTLTLHDKPAITSLPHVLDLISTFLDCSADIPLHQACALGSLSLLDRIWTQSLLPLDKCRRWCPAASLQTNRHYKRWQFSQSLLQAVRRRDLSIVEWLFSHFTHCVSDVGVVEEAASTGQLEILKFLLENDREYTQDEYEFAHTAATSGSEEVLIEGNSVTWGSKDLQLAAKNGHHDVVCWLYEHTEGIDRKESRVLKYVVRTGGDFSLVQWLCSQGIEVEDSLEVADEAAAVGNLPMLQWMITEEFAVDFEENGPYEIQLPSDHLEVIKWPSWFVTHLEPLLLLVAIAHCLWCGG